MDDDPFDKYDEDFDRIEDVPDLLEAADLARKDTRTSPTRGGHLELRQAPHHRGRVHVVQRHPGGRHMGLCGIGADGMATLEADLEPREIRRRSQADPDWCTRCLAWVARW